MKYMDVITSGRMLHAIILKELGCCNCNCKFDSFSNIRVKVLAVMTSVVSGTDRVIHRGSIM